MKWTATDIELIRQADLDGLTQGQIKKTRAPDWPIYRIQNMLAHVRCRRKSICVKCRNPWKGKYPACDSCRELGRIKDKTQRAERNKKGLCTTCGKPADGSMTLCKKHRDYYASYNKKPMPRKGLSEPLRWLQTSSPGAVMRLVPMQPRLVVDLFGGAGGTLRSAQQVFECPVVWNDIHQGLWNYHWCLKMGLHDQVWQAMGSVKDLDVTCWETLYQMSRQLSPLGAATLYMMALCVEDKDMRRRQVGHVFDPPPRAKAHLKSHGRKLKKVALHNTDFTEMIDRYDSSETLFIVDPPFIGQNERFEHHLTGRHEELIERLAGLRGQYLLFQSSTRPAAVLVADQPYNYWRWAYRFKSMVTSSMELDPAISMERLDMERFGLR